MVVILKENTTDEQKNQLIGWFKDQGLKVHESDGEYKTILGLVGNVDSVDQEMLEMLDMVDRVTRISEPYKNANRKFHPKDTVIKVGDAVIGGGNFAVIAGPGLVESKEQIETVARSIKTSGADFLQGGTFRASQPLYQSNDQIDGITLLKEAKTKENIPVVSELMSLEQLRLLDDVDVIQVGARNMQNYEMLRELGRIGKPVIITRGLANTLEELLMSAEHVMAGGNDNVILCECGIRTFEQYTKNTLDLSAIPVLHERTHLPVVVDPCHGTGNSKLVLPMALAAAAVGADGLMIEVHNDPKRAASGGVRSISPEEFDNLMERVSSVRESMR